MAQRGARTGWDSPADRPSLLEITVESAPRRGPGLRPMHVVMVIAIAALGVIAAAVVVGGLPGGGGGGAARSPTQASTSEQPSVLVKSGPPSATAPGLYRFPIGCPDARVTAVERNRRGVCAPHDGYVIAVVRRVRGVWRVTLTPADQSCTLMPVPPLARGKVKICRR